MKKIIFLSVVLISLGLLPCCKMVEDSFQAPVKDYFEVYTETAAIEKYVFEEEPVKDKNGVFNVSSDKDLKVSFYLRNPKLYEFSVEKNMKLEFTALDQESVEDTFGKKADVSLASIVQNENDRLLISLLIPSEMLNQAECGFDVSPFITLTHPLNGKKFDTYSGLKILSNSPPPNVYGAVVYKDTSINPNKYVLMFNMPSKGLMKGIHRDIEKLTIISPSKNYFYGLKTYPAFGTFEVEGSGSKLMQGDISGDSRYTPGSVSFNVSGQPVYFFTDDEVSSKDSVYKIALEDSRGLTSEVLFSVYSVQLGQITLKDREGNVLSAGSQIQQDEGEDYATVTFEPSAIAVDPKTGDEFNTEDSSIMYEIYQGVSDTGRSLMNGTGKPGKAVFKIPVGNIFTKVYAHKDGFADSGVQTLNIKVLATQLYVSAAGSDMMNNGTKGSPFATMDKAAETFADITENNKLYLLSDISDTFSFSSSGGRITVGSLNGEVYTITGSINISDGSIIVNDQNISGTVTVSGADSSIEINNAVITGKIVAASGSKVVLNNCVVKGSIESKSGAELIINGSQVTMGGKIEGQSSIELGGDTRINGTVSIDSENSAYITLAEDFDIQGIDIEKNEFAVLLAPSSYADISSYKILRSKSDELSQDIADTIMIADDESTQPATGYYVKAESDYGLLKKKIAEITVKFVDLTDAVLEAEGFDGDYIIEGTNITLSVQSGASAEITSAGIYVLGSSTPVTSLGGGSVLSTSGLEPGWYEIRIEGKFDSKSESESKYKWSASKNIYVVYRITE